MDEILKGNFKVKRPVKLENAEDKNETLQEEFRKRALASIGGSMVYVERNKLNWDGNE